MATQLIMVQDKAHLSQIMTQFSTMLVFFDNKADRVCQLLKAPLFAKCRAQNMPIAIVQIDVDPLRHKFPCLNVVKDGEAAMSLYEFEIDALWAQIQKCLIS